MKRSKVLKKLEDMIFDYKANSGLMYCDEDAENLLNYLEKEVGMLPPTCTVTVKDGKHTPTERRWDEE